MVLSVPHGTRAPGCPSPASDDQTINSVKLRKPRLLWFRQCFAISAASEYVMSAPSGRSIAASVCVGSAEGAKNGDRTRLLPRICASLTCALHSWLQVVATGESEPSCLPSNRCLRRVCTCAHRLSDHYFFAPSPAAVLFARRLGTPVKVSSQSRSDSKSTDSDRHCSS